MRLTNERLDIDALLARSNQATLGLSYHQAGWAADSPRTIDAKLRQVELDAVRLKLFLLCARKKAQPILPSSRCGYPMKS